MVRDDDSVLCGWVPIWLRVVQRVAEPLRHAVTNADTVAVAIAITVVVQWRTTSVVNGNGNGDYQHVLHRHRHNLRLPRGKSNTDRECNTTGRVIVVVRVVDTVSVWYRRRCQRKWHQ